MVVAVRNYLSDKSPSSIDTAAVSREVMRTNPALVRHAESDPVNGDGEPDEGSIAVSFLFDLVIARPQTISKVLDLLEAVWSIGEDEKGVERMPKREWQFEIGEHYSCEFLLPPSCFTSASP